MKAKGGQGSDTILDQGSLEREFADMGPVHAAAVVLGYAGELDEVRAELERANTQLRIQDAELGECVANRTSLANVLTRYKEAYRTAEKGREKQRLLRFRAEREEVLRRELAAEARKDVRALRALLEELVKTWDSATLAKAEINEAWLADFVIRVQAALDECDTI